MKIPDFSTMTNAEKVAWVDAHNAEIMQAAQTRAAGGPSRARRTSRFRGGPSDFFLR